MLVWLVGRVGVCLVRAMPVWLAEWVVRCAVEWVIHPAVHSIMHPTAHPVGHWRRRKVRRVPHLISSVGCWIRPVVWVP